LRYLLIIIPIALLLFYSCKEESPVFEPTPYELVIPIGFPEMSIPESNQFTVEGIALGKKLYYDNILDKNQARACATCHLQEQSFSSQPNVLPHVNLGWNHNWLWKADVQGSVEDIMAFEVEYFFETNLDNLNNHSEYPGLFKKAFNVDLITYNDVEKALAQFVRTLISGNSKFDKIQRGEAQFTNQENLGFELFYTEKGDCFHCHATAFFSDNQVHNNALDVSPEPGYYEVTGDPLDYGKFKSPTLRNIDYTAPYMHDGRYSSLEEVIDFYSEGLQESPTVDPLMKKLSTGGIQLSVEEKEALVAFLKTLSDDEFIQNPQFSND
jgi:cytochrome c peroxidase